MHETGYLENVIQQGKLTYCQPRWKKVYETSTLAKEMFNANEKQLPQFRAKRLDCSTQENEE